MLVRLSDNSKLDTVKHHTGQQRSYNVELVNGKTFLNNFSYKESDVNEVIVQNGLALSGANSRHYFGIIKDGNYHYTGFSKGNKAARTDSVFWKKLPANKIGQTVDINIDHAPKKHFDQPINLWFSINAYWHWFNEDIPLIKFLRKNNHAIVTNKLSEWQKESLGYFPDIQKRLIELETPTVIEAPRFHLFTKPDGGAGKNCEWVSLFLKEHLTPSKDFEPMDKVYIGRGDADARAVDNEQELIDLLIKKDFKIYTEFSKINLQEKIDIFNRSKLVVSPTGANLCHCYAMHEGSTVIDFNHKFLLKDEHWYNNIGSACGLKWKTLGAGTGSRNKRPRERNRNLIVDLNLIESVVA